MIRKGQAILEFALIFIIVVALALGLLGLWEWSNGNIPARQGAFEDSRISAGTKKTPGVPMVPYNAKTPDQPHLL